MRQPAQGGSVSATLQERHEKKVLHAVTDIFWSRAVTSHLVVKLVKVWISGFESSSSGYTCLIAAMNWIWVNSEL